jgi:putative transposase
MRPLPLDFNRRRTLRLKKFNYSTAAIYFVTVCTRDRQAFFGNVDGGHMCPSVMGRIVSECWFELPYHYARLELGAFALMPNHVHGLISLRDSVGAGLRPAPTAATVSEIVGVFKSFAARRIHEADASLPAKVWQRGFYEHIVRSGDECAKIQRYILQNPARWEFDRENSLARERGDPEIWES